jgi:hypothetical protein
MVMVNNEAEYDGEVGDDNERARERVPLDFLNEAGSADAFLKCKTID